MNITTTRCRYLLCFLCSYASMGSFCSSLRSAARSEIKQAKAEQRQQAQAENERQAWVQRYNASAIGVITVQQPSRAYSAGLQNGHRITVVGGYAVYNTQELRNLIQRLQASGQARPAVIFTAPDGSCLTLATNPLTDPEYIFADIARPTYGAGYR